MNNRKGIATYYILTLLLGSIVVGVLTYQVYKTTSFIAHYEAPPLPTTTITSLTVSSSTCQNAQNSGLCDGLNIAYGDCYKEDCCTVFEKCCG
jgi:hypothetical protein